jgi:hypothetical protein
MVLPFLFPAELIIGVAGSGRGEEPSGGKVLGLIQIRLSAAEFSENYGGLSSQSRASACRRFQRHKRSQLFSSSQDEAAFESLPTCRVFRQTALYGGQK